jgi:tetraacyldisaccharide 4'-kinase
MAQVIVGRKREESAAFAATLGKKAVILDDGMQYLRLQKDLEIVCVRAKDPFGSGFVPFGKRRELKSELSKAHYIMIHGAGSVENYHLVKRSLLCYSRAECFGTRYSLKSNKEFNGRKVGVFCGIGNPQAFMSSLRELNVNIVNEKILADHEEMGDIESFCKESKLLGAEKILCTYKDYVKLSEIQQRFVSPVEIELDVVFDKSIYKELIMNIDNKVENLIEG